ncbi:MAG: HpcH/HpaI aldolase family protein [Limisphaerales bacterium]|jgi:2-keto-3-deoxy-L-rhamnonate aldolase RhmA|nr:aldolase [Pedosphaera sp.]MAN30446.1 aldolase [Pedosphaera sp.]MEC7903739.1 aldolase/citrate lyase family protein [Verrucomicrobiota bacterium]HBF03975.1 aldolase [Verrucomicrobiales bacterium]HCB98279.1 aldolase [Verrucomicrobiales bacterium]|tara:strand:- start:402 stop:1220 length:819 start_codon:yes stop_codon:yes gene_type:complete
MHSEGLLQHLRSGKRAYGTAILTASPLWPPLVAKTGLDFVFIDSEHIALDRQELSWMCRTYDALGLAPLVRIASPDPILACQVLDGGACGCVAPYVETPEQVKALVGAVKWRPLKGKKLEQFLTQGTELEPDLRQYLEERNRKHWLLVNIESQPAIDQLDAILDVPGLDGILIGPHDLSCSLGIPEQYEDPRFERAVKHIISKARKRNMIAGNHFCESMQLHAKWAASGENLIIRSNDLYLFSRALREEIHQMKSILGDDSSMQSAPQPLVI